MTTLTEQEYRALASSITIPEGCFIDGGFRAGSGQPMISLNPYTKHQLASFQGASTADVEMAVRHARRSFDTGVWRHQSPSDRKHKMLEFCRLIYRHRHELAVLESLDSGKPIRDCALIDIPEAIECIRWHAEMTDKLYQQAAPEEDAVLTMIGRIPRGVVACILPWNFPLLMLAWKLGPALSAGNSVIIKPAEQTSLTALKLAELAIEADIPRGVFQVLPGLGEETGQAIGLHHGIDMISFTGSTDTGRQFLKYSAESNLKDIVLECGGKNAAIVLDDAQHWDAISQHIIEGALWNLGQNCSAISRLILTEHAKSQLLPRLRNTLTQWQQGDPLDPSSRLGVLIDENHADKVKTAMETAHTDQIETIQTEANEALICVDVPTDHRLATDEIFGPVLSVFTVKSLDEALSLANSSHYGLTASVFTNHLNQGIRTAKAIDAGTITVNCYGEGNISTPFGGFKQSGFGGRDNGISAHHQFTHEKTIWISTVDQTTESID